MRYRAKILASLAACHKRRGDLIAAESCLHRVLQDLERYSAEVGDLATACLNLSSIYAAQKKHIEAVQHAHSALVHLLQTQESATIEEEQLLADTRASRSQLRCLACHLRVLVPIAWNQLGQQLRFIGHGDFARRLMQFSRQLAKEVQERWPGYGQESLREAMAGGGGGGGVMPELPIGSNGSVGGGYTADFASTHSPNQREADFQREDPSYDDFFEEDFAEDQEDYFGEGLEGGFEEGGGGESWGYQENYNLHAHAHQQPHRSSSRGGSLAASPLSNSRPGSGGPHSATQGVRNAMGRQPRGPFTPPRRGTAAGARPSTAREREGRAGSGSGRENQPVLSSRFAGRLRAVCESGVEVQCSLQRDGGQGGVLTAIESQAISLAEASSATVYLIDPGHNLLWTATTAGDGIPILEYSMDGEAKEHRDRPLSVHAAVSVAKNGQEWEDNEEGLLACPLQAGPGQESVGVLVVGRGQGQLPFSVEDRDVLRLFARTCGPNLTHQDALRQAITEHAEATAAVSRSPTRPASHKPSQSRPQRPPARRESVQGEVPPTAASSPGDASSGSGGSFSLQVKRMVDTATGLSLRGLSLVHLLQACEDEAMGLFGACSAVFYILDSAKDEVWSCKKADDSGALSARRWSIDGNHDQFLSSTNRYQLATHPVRGCVVSGEASFGPGGRGSVMMMPVHGSGSEGARPKPIAVLSLERDDAAPVGDFCIADQELCDIFMHSLTGCIMTATRLHQLEQMWHIAGYEEPCRDIPSVMKRLAAMAESVLNVEHCYMYAVNRVTKNIEVYPDPDNGEMMTFPMGTAVVGHVASSGEMLILDKPSGHPRFVKEYDHLFKGELHAMGCVPVVINSQVEGVLLLANKKGEETPFGITDFPTFKALANHASNAIQVAAVAQKMDALMAMSVRVNSELDLVKVMQMLMDEVVTLVKCDRCTLFLLDEENGELWAAIGELEIRMKRQADGTLPGIAGSVADTGKILNIPDAYQDSRFNQAFDKKSGYKTDSILCFPLKDQTGKTIGCAQLINKLTGVFTTEDEVLLKTISSQAVVAIQNSKLFANVEKTKEQAKSVMTAISATVVALKPDGTLESCNHIENLIEITGKTAEEMMKSTYETWLGETSEVLLKDISDMYEAAKDKENFEQNAKTVVRPKVDFKLPDGSEQMYEYNLMPIMGVDNSSMLKKKKKDGVVEPKLLQGVVITMEDQTAEKQMQATLSQYMDPALVDQLLGDGGNSVLGGNRQKVSILFADIRSFTSLSEGLDSADVVTLLNDYFTIMVDIVLEHKGILDKYIGDAFMVEYGIPFTAEDDTYRSCCSALKMMDALGVFNDERALRGVDLVNIGIGINTDIVLSGNIGSPKRMEYTVIGDGVNLASRLEGSTKQYKCDILISGNTYDDIKDTGLICRQLDMLQVVGKKKATTIYQLMCKSEAELTENQRQSIPIFADARELYVSRKWVEAQAKFNECAALGDRPALTFIDRCQEFIDNPASDPGEGWTGVYIATGK